MEPTIALLNAEIYQKNVNVLTDVSLSVMPGEFVYLIGKVGSGKTSIIKTLYAGLPLRKGAGTIVGFNLLKIRNRQIPMLRRNLGVIFQDFQLLSDRSVKNNLAFVLKATNWTNKKEIDERIIEVLQKVELEDKLNKMPHQLSGGEQQRVVIARALLNNPAVILADEPTGNLDPETSEGIMRLLFDIQEKKRTVVMATHNYTLLKKFAARTFKCENGKLTEMTDMENTIDFENLLFENH